MSGQGAGKANLTAVISKERKAMLRGRAKAVEYSLSQYTAGIIEWWIQMGTPPIDELEAQVWAKGGARPGKQ